MLEESRFPFELLAVARAEATARTAPITRTDHEVWVMEYVLSGAGVLQIGDTQYQARANDVYILPKGGAHSYWPDRNDPWHKLFLIVDGDFVTYLFEHYRLLEVYFLPHAAALLHYFEEFEVLSRNHALNHGRAAVIFHQLIEECARRRHTAGEEIPPEITALKHQLDAQLEKRFNLSVYAAASGVSRAHLIRRFRQVYGVSPGEYLLTRKIELARNLLQYSQLSVKEIACRLHFSDQYYFSNYFKRRTGCSPSALRQARQRDA